MNLQQLKQKKLEEFEEGCNMYNISDPPSDKRWIISFLSQAMDDIQNATIEAGQEALPKKIDDKVEMKEKIPPDVLLDMFEDMKKFAEGYHTCLSQSHSALNNLKTKR